jgi:hypothetical protein
MRDFQVVLLLAGVRLLLHCATNGQYGFHRDELAYFDDGRYLDWGYPAYPPFTPFLARISRELFGTSLVGLRFFAAFAQALVVVLAADMAKLLGGGRRAMILTAAMVCVAPVSIGSGALFQYVSFDYFWFVLAAWCSVRLLTSEEPRWWIGIGAAIGFGLLTKFTMGVFAIGIAAGTLLTSARSYLKSKWLWLGAVLAVLLFLPNLIWQYRHDFISVDMLRSIHERDVRIGRTDWFIPHQFYLGSNPLNVPFWIAGLVFLFRRPRFRMIAWMYVVPLAMFVALRGRDYYLAPAYAMLLAAGAVAVERWLDVTWRRRLVWGATAAGAILAIAIVIPAAPIGSAWWRFASEANGDLREEIGWPDLVQNVAAIRDRLNEPIGILTGNYGEAGAINLYREQYKLPEAISGVNSYWLRGYPSPPPETLIVLGWSRSSALRYFQTCEIAARNTNRFGVQNEESKDHPDILVCRGLKVPWPEFWKLIRRFG